MNKLPEFRETLPAPQSLPEGEAEAVKEFLGELEDNFRELKDEAAGLFGELKRQETFPPGYMKGVRDMYDALMSLAEERGDPQVRAVEERFWREMSEARKESGYTPKPQFLSDLKRRYKEVLVEGYKLEIADIQKKAQEAVQAHEDLEFKMRLVGISEEELETLAESAKRVARVPQWEREQEEKRVAPQPMPVPLQEVKISKEERAGEAVVALENIWEDFYGKHVQEGKVAGLSQGLYETERRLVQAGVISRDELEKRREEVMRRVGYWDVLSQKVKVGEPQKGERAQIAWSPEDEEKLGRLLKGLEAFRTALKELLREPVSEVKIKQEEQKCLQQLWDKLGLPAEQRERTIEVMLEGTFSV